MKGDARANWHWLGGFIYAFAWWFDGDTLRLGRVWRSAAHAPNRKAAA